MHSRREHAGPRFVVGLAKCDRKYIDGMHGRRVAAVTVLLLADRCVEEQAPVAREKPRDAFIRPRGEDMKQVTVDMLRAHLMVASLTALAADVLACVTVAVLPGAQHLFVSAAFRLAALAMVVGGVIVARQIAQAAFQLAVEERYANVAGLHARPVAVAPDCPRLWLVILHLRLTGTPFVLRGH